MWIVLLITIRCTPIASSSWNPTNGSTRQGPNPASLDSNVHGLLSENNFAKPVFGRPNITAEVAAFGTDAGQLEPLRDSHF